jgi:hypothetical protein
MISACRDDYSIAFPCDMFFRPIQDKLCFTFFNSEELIHLGMHFVSDFLAYLQAHQNELGMFAGEYHLAEIMVLFGQFFDGSNETGHMIFLLVWLLE